VTFVADTFLGCRRAQVGNRAPDGGDFADVVVSFFKKPTSSCLAGFHLPYRAGEGAGHQGRTAVSSRLALGRGLGPHFPAKSAHLRRLWQRAFIWQRSGRIFIPGWA